MRAIHRSAPRIHDDSGATKLAASTSGSPVQRTADAGRRLQRHAGLQAGERDVRARRREHVGVLAGHEPIRQAQHRDAEHADHQRRATRRADRPWAADRPRRCTLHSASMMCCLHLPREGEALVLAADARHRSVDEHQREVLGLLAAELVEPPEDRADAIERGRVLERAVADASPDRRAAGIPLRRARRRCRPCWGSSRRWRRGCTRCARRSCGSKRSGNPRRRTVRGRRREWRDAPPRGRVPVVP